MVQGLGISAVCSQVNQLFNLSKCVNNAAHITAVYVKSQMHCEPFCCGISIFVQSYVFSSDYQPRVELRPKGHKQSWKKYSFSNEFKILLK